MGHEGLHWDFHFLSNIYTLYPRNFLKFHTLIIGLDLYFVLGKRDVAFWLCLHVHEVYDSYDRFGDGAGRRTRYMWI
jgi:hypothetical protein